MLRIGALLLFLVFAIKAALVPLHWWVPATYAAASAPVAALFMIMTKIGVYATLRVYGTVFGADAGPLAGIAEPWIVPAALATVTLGAIGILASRALLDLVAFAIVGSMGMLLIAVGLAGASGVTTALYYLVHSTLSGAALFLIVDLIAERRGRVLDRLVPAPEIRQQNLLGGLFLLGAIAIVGLPPLSGFIGKLMILETSRGAIAAPWIWSVVLGMTLVMVLGFARAGSAVFWNVEPGMAVEAGRTVAAGQIRRTLPLVVAGLLIAATAALSGFAGPVTLALRNTAEQTLDTQAYVRAVLGPAALPPQARR
ncbi:MAG TPA: proton-conducting transporter membrane subunit [Stellaceae bacterium]|nr:proton-conducting transporter membrane subunit [Stellaceae bacterium]